MWKVAEHVRGLSVLMAERLALLICDLSVRCLKSCSHLLKRSLMRRAGQSVYCMTIRIGLVAYLVRQWTDAVCGGFHV